MRFAMQFASRMKNVTLRLPEKMNSEIVRIATRNGIKRSDIVRMAVIRLLEDVRGESVLSIQIPSGAGLAAQKRGGK